MSLRVLLVNVGYPPFVGGAQSYTQLLAESLVRDGHRVAVYCTDAGEVEAIWNAGKERLPTGSQRVNGVEVNRTGLRHVPPSPFGYYLLRRATVALARLPGVPEGLLWQLARFTPWVPDLVRGLTQVADPPDVVHGFTIPFESLLKAAVDCGERFQAPCVITPFLHLGEEGSHTVASGYTMPHQIALLKRAAAVITLSEMERAFLVGRGLAPGRVHTIPAGIAFGSRCSTSQPRDPSPQVLFLGAVTYDKGAVHLTEAVRRLRSEGLEVRLILAGTITDQFRHYYQGLPEEARSSIRLPGVVSEAEKQALLSSCTLLAMPSRVDSFGLVYLEAWSYSKPVIAARAGGVPAVIDHENNGLLVPFGDVGTLASAIRSLVVDPATAARLGQAGYEKLHAYYAWERVYPRILEVYAQVTGR